MQRITLLGLMGIGSVLILSFCVGHFSSSSLPSERAATTVSLPPSTIAIKANGKDSALSSLTYPVKTVWEGQRPKTKLLADPVNVGRVLAAHPKIGAVDLLLPTEGEVVEARPVKDETYRCSVKSKQVTCIGSFWYRIRRNPRIARQYASMSTSRITDPLTAVRRGTLTVTVP